MPSTAEDKILSIVFTRLKTKCGFTLEQMSKDTGIPVSTLCDMSAGCAQRFMSRIPTVAKYFRVNFKLDYVNCEYLLTGTEDDRAELLKLVERLEKEKKDLENRLSFFKYLEEKKEAV